MANALGGWAWASGPAGQRLLLHTDDGGETWEEVTPRGFSYNEGGSCFRDAHTAWIPIFDKTNVTTGLLQTTDAGKSWTLLTVTNAPILNEGSSCTFFTPTYGIASKFDNGVRNSFVKFFETHDAGKTWSQIPLTPRYPGSTESSNSISLSNIGGDQIAFYPPSTTIIAYGDSDDEQAKGNVRLSLTTDCGKTWRDMKLPSQREYRDCPCNPLALGFLDQKNVVLPALVHKSNADGTYSPSVLIVYTSRDGGSTWSVRPGVVDLKEPTEIGFFDVSPECFFAKAGPNLFVTHDAARTWAAIKTSILLGEHPDRDIQQMDFVDATHGWLICSDHSQLYPNGKILLYRTSDGGKTWTELPVRMTRTVAVSF